MEPTEQDVKPDSSPGASDSPAVSGAQVPHDRPVENVMAEFNRKYARQQQQLEAVIQWIATQQQVPTPIVTQANGELTDEDLWRQAQQGDRKAFEMYQERIADRRLEKKSTIQTRAQMVQAQLQIIGQRYPVLADPQHPLSQTAQMAYHLLTQNGYPPGPETQLEALKTAITDRPDLIAELQSQNTRVQDATRQSATRTAQSGVMGSTVRQSAPQTGKPPATRVSEAERALAQRMNISDPAKAKERFLKRQEEGKSKLGAVAGFLGDQAEEF